MQYQDAENSKRFSTSGRQVKVLNASIASSESFIFFLIHQQIYL